MEIEESCEASDVEKTRAATAINNILSVLTHYSELTGRLVCGKRCSLSGVGLLSSSLNISLGRIKQSFVLWVVANSHFLTLQKVYHTFWRFLIIILCVCFDMIVLPCRTDPHLPDMPIVYASDAFFKLTGNIHNAICQRDTKPF